MGLSTNLKFSPYAWAKLLFWANAFDHEISGMGISLPSDPLTVVDIKIIKQVSSVALTTFDMDAYGEFVLEYCDPDGAHKLKPTNCQRIYFHTHPAGVAGPSHTDEQTFADGWGECSWAIMAILPKNGSLYARMHCKVGADDLNLMMTSAVAWHLPFQAADHKAWREEVEKYVTVNTYSSVVRENLNYLGEAPGIRHVSIPSESKTTTKAPTNKAPAKSNIIQGPAPFNDNKIEEPASRKHLNKRERRRMRMQEALQDIEELNASGTKLDRLYASDARLKVPPMTLKEVEYLEQQGAQAVWSSADDVYFNVQVTDGSWKKVCYQDAWLFIEDQTAQTEEVGAFEWILSQYAHGRKLGTMVTYGGKEKDWTEPAEHKYVLKHIEITNGPAEIYLTDTENEAMGCVISGRLTADEAAYGIPDVVDDDSLTERTLSAMMSEKDSNSETQEILVLGEADAKS